MQRLKLRIEESGEKLSAAYAPPKWSETAGKGKGITVCYHANLGCNYAVITSPN